jgi:ubiquitin C
MTGKRVKVEIGLRTTCEDVKAQIQEREGIPPDQQRLIWHGRQLEDGDVLMSLGVRQGDEVLMVLRLRG